MAGEPGEGAFDFPAVAAEAFAGVETTPCNPGCDAAAAYTGIKHLATLTLTTSDGDTTTLTTTTEHPVWSENQDRWVDAEDLNQGDQLRTTTGDTVGVAAVYVADSYRRVHNSTIKDLHTYYAGQSATSVVVHNSNCDWRVDSAEDIAVGHADTKHGGSFPGCLSPIFRTMCVTSWRTHCGLRN